MEMCYLGNLFFRATCSTHMSSYSSHSPSSSRFNGRVNIKTPDTSVLFSMQDAIPAKQAVGYRDALEGMWDASPLSHAYFSAHNIQLLQNAIRYGVYVQSNKQYVIGEQSQDELKTVMRSVYLQHARNMPTDIREQIEALNTMVTTYCIQQIYSEAQGRIQYLWDASTLVVPLAHPVMTTRSDKSLEFTSWFSPS